MIKVPLMIEYMGGVDMFDQIRKEFGCDLVHPTQKWTVRLFEVLHSMILAQSYNIHRALHDGDRKRHLSHNDFALSVVRGLLANPVVTPVTVPPVNSVHKLAELPPMSREGATRNRRRRYFCRECPRLKNDGHRNSNRLTSWYCRTCDVAFHPDCFVKYHERLAAAEAKHQDESPPPPPAEEKEF